MSDSATLWTVACQAPLYVKILQARILEWEYRGGLPCPPPEDLPDPGIEPMSLMSPALAGVFFITSTTWDANTRLNRKHSAMLSM